MFSTKKIIKRPLWFSLIMIASGHVIIYWPFLFYVSIFFFDSPGASSNNEILFYVSTIWFYPLVVLLFLYAGRRIFLINKLVGSLLAVIPFLAFLALITVYLVSQKLPEHHIKNNQVYFRNYVIENANAETFVSLGRLVGKDEYHVFYTNDVILDADPNTYELINEKTGRDKNSVFYENTKCVECDADTFRKITDDWFVDKSTAYHAFHSSLRRIEDVDVETFEALNSNFAKDKYRVYANMQPISGADPASFQVPEGICIVCGQDKNNCYRLDEVVSCKNRK